MHVYIFYQRKSPKWMQIKLFLKLQNVYFIGDENKNTIFHSLQKKSISLKLIKKKFKVK